MPASKYSFLIGRSVVLFWYSCALLKNIYQKCQDLQNLHKGCNSPFPQASEILWKQYIVYMCERMQERNQVFSHHWISSWQNQPGVNEHASTDFWVHLQETSVMGLALQVRHQQYDLLSAVNSTLRTPLSASTFFRPCHLCDLSMVSTTVCWRKFVLPKQCISDRSCPFQCTRIAPQTK